MIDEDAHGSQFGFSYDQGLCTGCKTCEMACKDYHDLGSNVSFRTVYEYAGEPGSRIGWGVGAGCLRLLHLHVL